MKNNLNKIIAVTFILYISVMLIVLLLLKPKEFSYLENRTLQTIPKITLNTFKNGSFGKKFEEYIADQFPLRNSFVAVKSYAELFMQKKEEKDVYIGKDGYLLQKFNEPNKKLLDTNISYINKFSESFNTYFMLAPTATEIYKDKLPSYAKAYSEVKFTDELNSKLNSNIHFVPLINALTQNKNKYIYYKTDHHWTNLGAYYAYKEFCSIYGIEALKLNDFEIKDYSKNFYGSLFSKGNFIFIKPDTLQILKANNHVQLQVNYIAEGEVSSTLYEEKNLKEKDKYKIFLNGNHPIVKINTSIKNGKKLLVIKDSYANSLIPFLVNHFEEIQIVDMRFLNVSIAQYAKDNNLKDVLLLYNTHNFAIENTFSLLKH